MPKIGNISLKDPIVLTDKLLGSDSAGVPKNFDIDVIKDYTIIDVKNSHLSVGIIDNVAPILTDNNDGTATIGPCTIAIRDNSNHSGFIKTFSVAESTFTFNDGEQEYIIVDYNSGTPIYQKTSVMPNGSDKSLICVVWRIGIQIHSVNQDSIGLGLPNKINSRLLNTEPYAVSSLGGLVISESATPTPRTILVSGAVVYVGNTPQTVIGFDSSIDDMYKVVLTATGWTYTLIDQYDNLHINPDSLGEVELGNNKWKYNLFYRSIDDDSDVFFVESEQEYNSAEEARVASTLGRQIPIILKNHCIFIGRSIIQKNATNGITEPFIRTRGDFTSYIPSHNDLTGIQGGTTDQYYHLTQLQQESIVNTRFGDYTGGNYTQIESDGTIILNGTATAYDDIFLPVTSLGSAVSAPDLINVNNTGIYLYGYDGGTITEQLYGCFEVPHNYKNGSDIVPHVHWAPSTTNTGTVTWYVDFWRVNDGNTIPSTVTTISATGTADGVAWKTFRTDTDIVDGTNITMGNQIAFRLYRNPTTDTYPNDAIIMTFGIHYEIDGFGSRQITTK